MGVKQVNRTKSEFLIFTNTNDILKQTRDLVLKDFGIKANVRTSPVCANGTWSKDKEGNITIAATLPKEKTGKKVVQDVFLLIPEGADPNNGSLKVAEFPEWMLDKFREEALNYALAIQATIRQANDINIYYPDEYHERRRLQTKAISLCDNLVDLLTLMIDCIPVSVNKISPLVRLIMDEKRLITAWKKGENKKLVLAMQNEENRRKQALKISTSEIDNGNISLSKEQLIKMILALDDKEINTLNIIKN
jgi:hypothetical protein